MRGNKQSLISQIAGVLLALILVFSVVKVLGIQNIWDINEWRTSLSGAGKSLEQTLDNPPKFTPGSSNDSGSETSSSSTDSGAASEQPPADASSETNTEALLASLTVGKPKLWIITETNGDTGTVTGLHAGVYVMKFFTDRA